MRYFICSLVVIFSQLLTGAQVSINEYSAANRAILQDNGGEYEDFVELYNAGTSAVNLGGYYLSDKESNPTKWQIPSTVSIEAGSTLLVWCSGRNTNFGGAIHSNFKLTQTKGSEYVVLSDPSETIIESILLDPTQTNHSRAKTLDGGNIWGVDTSPSPGAPNTSVLSDYAQKPVANFNGGLYSSSVSLTWTSDADIYYTTNGRKPSLGSSLYTGPIDVSATGVVRAIAISSDPMFADSFIETNTYFINDSHTVPVISVSGGDVGGQTIANLLDGAFSDPVGSFEYFDANQNLINEGVGHFNKHGNDSWAYAQRGFDYIARDQFGYHDAIRHQIFPNKDRDKFKRVMVKAAASDNYSFETGGAHLRDMYVHRLSQNGNLKLDERSGIFCVLYVDGEYWGVYDIREKVDDHDFTEHYYDQSQDDLYFIKTWGGTWAEYGGNDALDDWGDLYDFIVGNDMAIATNYDQVKSQFNLGSLVDYMILNIQIVNSDWLNWNTAWWRGTNPDGDKKKWRYVLWDLDASFDHYTNFTGIPDQSANADPCDVTEPVVGDPEGHTEMLSALLENEEFKNLYINRYADLNNSLFSCATMNALLDEMVATIAPEMPAQISRWGIGSVAGWEGNVQNMRDFINDRCTVVNDGIADCFMLDGPYLLSVDINDTNYGLLEINTIEPAGDEYVWSGEYFDGAPITITAEPEDCFLLDYWEVTDVTNGVETFSTESITLEMDEDHTVLAVFKPSDNIISINIGPVGIVATIFVDGEEIAASDLPFEICLNDGETLDLEVVPGPDTIFGGWQTENGALGTPSETSVTFTAGDPASGGDGFTIEALFVTETFEITFLVGPEGAGDFSVNGDDIELDNYVQEFAEGATVELEAFALEHYVFESWTLPDGSTVNTDTHDFTIDQDLTVNVNFVPVDYPLEINMDDFNAEGGGSVIINGETFTGPGIISVDIPFGSTVDIVIIPAEGFLFDAIESEDLNFIEGLPGAFNFVFDEPNGSFEFIFTELPPVCIVKTPTAFTPNNDGLNDVFTPLLFNCDIVDFKMQVYNRWGELVFQSSDPNIGWNGIHKKQTDMGVFIFQLFYSYNSAEGEFLEVSEAGFTTVIK